MEAIRQFEQAYRKPAIAAVRSGDTVRVHQQIREGSKTRIQVFEGVVIRTHRLQELTAAVTVRRIASGVGVEKTFLLHSPNVAKIEILRRARVRRNFLSYLRNRRGKSARLQEMGFDSVAVNAIGNVKKAEPEADEVDLQVEELDVAETQDAAEVPLDAEIKAENDQAAADDSDVSADDDQALAAEETQAGLDKAEPGEGDAVADNEVA